MNETHTLADYARTLWAHRWVLLIAVAGCFTSAVVMLALQDRVYQAEAEMLVELQSTSGVFDDSSTFRAADLERSVQTEIQIIEGSQVRQRVADDLALASLPPMAQATSIQNTDVIRVQVKSTSAGDAAVLADAYVAAYGSLRRDANIAELESSSEQLQAKIDELSVDIDEIALEIDDAVSAGEQASLAEQRSRLVDRRATFIERLDETELEVALAPSGATLIRPADVPDSPISPRPVRTLLIALAVGLILGAGTALLLETIDTRIRGLEDLEAVVSPLPVLASVPVASELQEGSLALVDPASPTLESIRGLRTNLVFLGIDHPMRVVQVTSSLPGEGKTTVAADLGVVLAHSGANVALIDCDLRKPRLHKVFGLPAEHGISSILAGESLEEAVYRVADGLDVVPCGPMPPNPSELLGSGAMSDLVDRLRKEYDHVVIDSAPVLPVSDSVALARHVDGVVLVCQRGRTRRDDTRRAIGALRQVSAPVIGTVLNRSDSSVAYAYAYAYSHT
ncbi:MAG: polysaccharide biosynthesis tyrosine autokinase [Ilumatobacter sp.]|uniref:polysaccharide biosynthesis tyrosine autokinase n=1 Tax=Ilumatobacter sp. TaxID=1967498 RepID=UPI00261C9228|nr:polysaccharide biosynthesis tyrosine autokinase [Ilumatobacter sp.]MDJ0769194.1 polysaccharide biosynthesis tyrosine autokinase [Ilumatobacter sp.]